MRRPAVYVQADRCDRCDAPVITSSRDALNDVDGRFVCDPTPLDVTMRAACVVLNRVTYRYGSTMAGGELGRWHLSTVTSHMNAPDDVIPEHVCRSTLAPVAAWFTRLDGVHVAYSEEPPY